MRKRIPKILVTGGAGFIGSEFVRFFVKGQSPSGTVPCKESSLDRLSLVVIDKLTYASDLERLKEIRNKIKFYRADICNKKQIEPIFKKERPEIVVNFAAESITEDTYIPIQSTPKIGTRMVSFVELWMEQSKNNKIQKSKKGEIIFLRGKQTKVLSFLNGGQWMPIKAISRHCYRGKIIKLIQKWGIITVTPNHSIYASNLKLTTPLENPELLVVRRINEHKKKYKKVEERLLDFLAAYITEGNTTFNKANGSYITEISQNNHEWLKHIGKIGKELFGLVYSIVKGKGAFHLQFSNKNLFNYLRKNCGWYSNNKFFPDWIFDLNPVQREYFWKKLLEGDGTKDGRYTTTSYKLANQISLLLALQQKDYRIFEREPKNRNWKKSWSFATKMDGCHYGLNKKKKIELNYSGWVYDLEVERSHNFICGLGNIVCHNTHVDRSILDSAPFIKTNVIGTQVLLDLSRKYKIKQLIHLSTDEVYGDIEKGKFSEDSPLKPNSPYAASKAAADLLIKAYIRTYDFPAIIIRPCNNYGPWQYPEKLIPLAILRILRKEKIPVYANGKNVREWIFVSDCARGIFEILKKGKIGEVYNLGSNDERQNIEVVKLILKNLQAPQSTIQFVKDRPGHDIRYKLNSQKLCQEIGWKPKIKFAEGIKITIQWCLEHKDWLLSKWKDIAELYK